MTQPSTGADAPASEAGVVFPLVEGRRSASAASQHVIASAMQRIDTATHDATRDETNWRSQYPKHIRALTRLSAGQHAPLIASDGLAAVSDHFRFLRQGAELPITSALAFPRANYLHSWSIAGGGDVLASELSVAYRGRQLSGEQLREQLTRWQNDGIVEPSFAAAIGQVVDNPQWLDLRDTTIVVLGASAELGPLESVLGWGAHVVAVDLAGEERWRRCIQIGRESPGKLTLPLRLDLVGGATDTDVARSAGVDIVTQAPEVCAWLSTLSGPLVLGDYVYAPGAAHLRLAVAIDAMYRHIMSERSDISLAYLASPTDTYCVPSGVVEDSQRRYSQAGAMVTAVRGVSAGRLYRPNYPATEATATGKRYGIADGLLTHQGSGYALAKRIQRWRAQQARINGVRVSINVAPATRTRSVVRNRILASAYAGADRFGIEIFDAATSSTLMAALLVHDLRNPTALSNPQSPVDDPFEVLVDGACHGGMWRGPFAPRSVLGVAVALGLFHP